MSKSTKTKFQIYKDALALFCSEFVPDEILTNYINDETGESSTIIQDWIANNMKGCISDWATSISIMDCVDLMYESALDNGNIK